MLGAAADPAGSFYLGRCGLPLLDTAAWLVCDKRQEPTLKAEATTNSEYGGLFQLVKVLMMIFQLMQSLRF